MQTEVDQGIVISCDFCGTDWDQQASMIEGHHGSVLCLSCFVIAYGQHQVADKPYRCTLCLRDFIPVSVPCWSWAKKHKQPGEHANVDAVVCKDCLDQAANCFDHDDDVDWGKPGKA